MGETMRHQPYGPYERVFKRVLDLICSLAAVIVFGWLYLIVALLVRIRLGHPVLFTQDRPGKDEKTFKLYKFRTMTNAKDSNGELLPDEDRLTAFGKFLRSTSLDELPEALNIIRGDMSLIGPRPLVVEYLPYYTEREHHRHDVRPGLTGLAQIHGRNYVSWSDRFEMDLAYVNKITFLGDLKILLDTVVTVLRRENIETASSIVHDGVLYRPLNIERSEGCTSEKNDG